MTTRTTTVAVIRVTGALLTGLLTVGLAAGCGSDDDGTGGSAAEAPDTPREESPRQEPSEEQPPADNASQEPAQEEPEEPEEPSGDPDEPVEAPAGDPPDDTDGGTGIDACYDGVCEVTLEGPATIPVDPALAPGLEEIYVSSVSGGSVTISHAYGYVYGSGNSTTTINGLTVEVVDIEGSTVTLKFSYDG